MQRCDVKVERLMRRQMNSRCFLLQILTLRVTIQTYLLENGLFENLELNKKVKCYGLLFKFGIFSHEEKQQVLFWNLSLYFDIQNYFMVFFLNVINHPSKHQLELPKK